MANKEMEVVKGLDLNRYMGRWYEIASFPSRNQPKNGTDNRATYTLRDDGTVHVLNETWTDGKRGFIEGTTYKADPSSDEAKLKLVQKAKEEGYDVSKLHKTEHTNPPPEGEEGPKDTKGIWWIKSIFGK
ncbi:hypothetical protein RHGRI_000325 [Rhododendron griersonianum]|uniref:Lipocalin/cytosolic fatty-acid binding domain-containing protein n=1 Tax=Rhododendron griersonianum TaxID=479676 RepID=A0AAV6LHB3_9ERIC|nr:hypothetical protein RHGRI_000325 [Rhododendron griersonianum]